MTLATSGQILFYAIERRYVMPEWNDRFVMAIPVVLITGLFAGWGAGLLITGVIGIPGSVGFIVSTLPALILLVYLREKRDVSL